VSQILHLAAAADIDRLLPMIAACHAEAGLGSDEATRRAGVEPLLGGSPHGAVWFIGPKMAPVGYIAVSFGWSIELGGMNGNISEFCIREKVRRRGMGSEALAALLKALRGADLKALHLEVAEGNARATGICERAGFRRRRSALMTWAA